MVKYRFRAPLISFSGKFFIKISNVKMLTEVSGGVERRIYFPIKLIIHLIKNDRKFTINNGKDMFY